MKLEIEVTEKDLDDLYRDLIRCNSKAARQLRDAAAKLSMDMKTKRAHP